MTEHLLRPNGVDTLCGLTTYPSDRRGFRDWRNVPELYRCLNCNRGRR